MLVCDMNHALLTRLAASYKTDECSHFDGPGPFTLWTAPRVVL
jgi:hypothetical protein